MSTLMFIAGIIILITGPLSIAVLVANYGHAQQARVFKERALEESRYHWLGYMGFKETRLYFDPYGIKVLSIWGPGIQLLCV